MNDPWAFGWTQVLTIAGLLVTVIIAVGGFRTFGRWKKEKIEEKRIEVAIDALALMYESRFIFDNIRSGFSFQGEWDDMPRRPGESNDMWNRRGSFYAILKRIEAHREFFERAWKLQVRCAAIFGPKVEETFLLLQKSRREVEVSAGMLMRDPEPEHRSADNLRTWESFREDVWALEAQVNGRPDRVGSKLTDFRSQIEQLCRPIVDHEFGRNR
jgi:hypothetical protein